MNLQPKNIPSYPWLTGRQDIASSGTYPTFISYPVTTDDMRHAVFKDVLVGDYKSWNLRGKWTRDDCIPGTVGGYMMLGVKPTTTVKRTLSFCVTKSTRGRIDVL